MGLLLLYGLFAVGTSFICSMLEAALLSVPDGYVEALARRGSRASTSLRGMKENIDRPLAAILTVNTIANTAGAAGVGAQAAVVFGGAATGIATGVMTLAILFISEIIPKTIGAAHCRGLAGFTAYATRLMVILCLPLVVVIELITRRLSREDERDAVSRVEVEGTLRLAHATGALGLHEHELIANVLALPDTRLSEVLTPRTVMFALPEEMTVDDVIARHSPLSFSRIPVYNGLPDYVTGYVQRFEIYRASVDGRGDETLARLRRPLRFLPELATVGSTLKQMLALDEHIAIVVDEYATTEGLVTLEDLIETLLGAEIIDETDSVTDLQDLARRKAARNDG